MPDSGRIYSIPATESFLDSLARAVLTGRLPDMDGRPPGAFDLARYEIYLPNRAACRALAATFLRLSPNRATLLPRIRPLGGAEEDELLLIQAEEQDALFDEAGLPVAPAIGALERRLALASLILAWTRKLKAGGVLGEAGARIADTPAAASDMALELIRLMDEAETEKADLSRLAALIPDRFADYEQLTLNFLNIVIGAWPAFLAERGLLNPADRRNRLMALETARLRRANPDTPVIVAGSTGSIPATAELMKAVLALPKGAIVLPGLDLALDETGWRAVEMHPEHPQAGLFSLLKELGVDREGVAELPGADGAPARSARMNTLSMAMRPASTLGEWPAYMAQAPRDELRAALENVSLIEAPDEQDEAAAIAMILRDVLETPGKTAHLVTPDPALARRVAAELARWGVAISGSEGEPLRTSPAGRFFELIADYAVGGAQIALLSVLKHPLTRLGLPEGGCGEAARLLEIAAMRQPWCGPGLDRLEHSLDLARKKRAGLPPLDRFDDEAWARAGGLLVRIRDSLAPLSALADGKTLRLDRIAAAHLAAAHAFAADESGDPSALAGRKDVEVITAFMTALASDMPGPELAFKDYPALWRSLVRLERASAPAPSHPRLRILTAMQARLASADLAVIAGLNEGVWPAAPDSGPWLNRAMREALGLPPPERRTRLAAHDFCQLLGAPEAIMTRALKMDGAPAVPSRWLMRLRTLLEGLGLADALDPPRPWLEWARARNRAGPPQPAGPPSPCPPPEARPRSLTVSNVETLIANPYAVYAANILGLRPFNPLEGEPGGAERGQIIHDALHFFTRRFEDGLPGDCAAELMAIFDSLAASYGDHAHVAAFWRPRMERFAEWFATTEPLRRGGALPLSELRGAYVFEAPGGPFRLRARADRIDLHADGSIAIYDYKSGGVPPESAVRSFRAPQLPLEALIAAEGGFEGIAKARVTRLAYISAKGGEPPGEELVLKDDPSGLAEGAREGLSALIAFFDDPATPYPALRRAAFKSVYAYDAYAHLARVAEWADEEGGET